MTTPRNPMTDLDMAEVISAALERYDYRTLWTAIVPPRGTHPARLLVIPENGYKGPLQVHVVSITASPTISSREDWRALSSAYGFRLEAPAFAEALHLTDPDHINHVFPIPGSGPAQ